MKKLEISLDKPSVSLYNKRRVFYSYHLRKKIYFIKSTERQNKYMLTFNEFSSKWKGKRAAVIGIGISNLPLIDFLLSAGVYVNARDKKKKEEIKDAEALLSKGVNLILGENYLDDLCEDIIFRTPGMRYDHPALTNAVKNGSYLTSEMQLFFEMCPARIIGITGSDGKTTTTTLISKILEEDGKRVFVGGNIGTPLLPRLSLMTENDFAVVELSSFQLHTMTVSPEISVITNISENHIDYHKTMEDYFTAKLNIISHPENKRAVLNLSSPYFEREASVSCGDAVTFSSNKDSDVKLKDGAIYAFGERYLEICDIKIPGAHNIENYMSTIAALYGTVKKESVIKVAKTFGGVEHRCELVREKDGVKYYNSSIDSSPSRTLATLGIFNQKIIAISGGYDKNLDYTPLADPLCKKVKAIILTGATSEKIRSAILSCPKYSEGKPFIFLAENIKEAVIKASEISESDDIVVLTPASASFDAFKNFEERGNFYKECVNAL